MTSYSTILLYSKWIVGSENQGQMKNSIQAKTFEPRSEKTGLRGFRPGLTQTGLYSYRRCLEHEILDLARRGIVLSV